MIADGGRQGPGNQGHQGGFQQRDNRRGGRQDAAVREGNAGNAQGRYRNMQFESRIFCEFRKVIAS